jgi:hypothetical protein
MTQQQTIFLPSERLPAAPKERHAALREYFCDKDASAIRTHQGWELTLDWPEDAGRHVDPKLTDGLAWWDQQLTRSGMAISTRRNGRILRTLYDSWTLHSWSEWLNRFGTPRTSIVILHVDDHRDIGSPRLFEEPGCWRDPITGDQVKISNPESISRAIRSGAIGMGSFLTPFLHAFPSSEVRHLCQPPKSIDTQDYHFDLVTQSDDLLDLDARRPAIQLIPSDHQTGPGHYRMTPKIGDWISGIGDGPILLHIDMDYFNNRYEGDSDWLDRRRKLDPPLAIVLDTIDQMVDALGHAGLASRLEDVVIAYSPGFFPGELWQAADERLTAAFERWNVR